MAEERDVREDDASAEGALDPLAQAQAHLEAGRPLEAVQLLEDLVQREPNNALAYQELAAALTDLARLGPAARAARRALKLDPSLYRPHGVLYWAALNQGREREAEAELRAQLGALPPQEVAGRANACNALAALYFRQRRYDEAAEALQQALELEPGRPLFRFNLATFYLERKQHDKATAELERLLALPEVPVEIARPAHFSLGQLYARQGRYADTRAQFAQALKIRRSILGQLYYAVPVLARIPAPILVGVLLVVAVLVWNLITVLSRR